MDADLANNTLGWQWVAGCGADAAPYFRIFNPTMQVKNYDPEDGEMKPLILLTGATGYIGGRLLKMIEVEQLSCALPGPAP